VVAELGGGLPWSANKCSPGARACWRCTASGSEVCHLVAKRLVDMTPLLGALTAQSRDFR
jgi:hypothetical protein